MNKLVWVKSSYSGGTGGNCVEIAALPGGGKVIRDSKDPSGPALSLSADQWAMLSRTLALRFHPTRESPYLSPPLIGTGFLLRTLYQRGDMPRRLDYLGYRIPCRAGSATRRL